MAGGLSIKVADWYGDASRGPEDASVGSLIIRAEDGEDPWTRIFDPYAKATRDHVLLPLFHLGEWLVCNWWRLRWEPLRDSADWRLAHCMNSIGRGLRWPPISFASDGEFIEVTIRPGKHPGIQYLSREESVMCPALDFERAVDEFLDALRSRLGSLSDLEDDYLLAHDELLTERRDGPLSELCRLQAIAGTDPDGEVDGPWAVELLDLKSRLGLEAAAELLAAVRKVSESTSQSKEALAAIESSPVTLTLGNLPETKFTVPMKGQLTKPWQRGYSMAKLLRQRLGLGPGKVRLKDFEDLLEFRDSGARSRERWSPDWEIRGAIRRPSGHSPCAVRSHPNARRFDLARVVYSHYANPQDRLLPVTEANTAQQQAQRAFAAEFLCPAQELNDFLSGKSSKSAYAIDDAASDFQVSTHIVRWQIQNQSGQPGLSALKEFAALSGTVAHSPD